MAPFKVRASMREMKKTGCRPWLLPCPGPFNGGVQTVAMLASPTPVCEFAVDGSLTHRYTDKYGNGAAS